MSNLKKVLLVNFLILIGYNLLFQGITWSQDYHTRSLGLAIGLAFAVLLHTTTLFILSIVFFAKKDRDRGLAHAMSMCIILVIGFSTCYGANMIING